VDALLAMSNWCNKLLQAEEENGNLYTMHLFFVNVCVCVVCYGHTLTDILYGHTLTGILYDHTLTGIRYDHTLTDILYDHTLTDILYDHILNSY